ncbi:hypothetical protein QJS10_CPB14g00186 [Acorus calamus]|uniref:Uncharacterized protein n=1 Tax=Acorus calamus TaxID=4465 RepID=A0AAV9DA90_ACOCL|nr:hypothetical protein QJS10_CPB14g00186 [Acorus calamus]
MFALSHCITPYTLYPPLKKIQQKNELERPDDQYLGRAAEAEVGDVQKWRSDRQRRRFWTGRSTAIGGRTGP